MPTDHKKSRGEIIRDFRESLKLSQTEFGKLIGVGQTAVANYESGDRPLGRDVETRLLKLAQEKHYPMTVFDLRRSV